MTTATGLRRMVLPVLGIGLTLVLLLLANRSVTPRDATWDDVEAQAREGGYRLISTIDVRNRQVAGADNVILVDTRQEWEFAAGHIDGAVNFPMAPTWWSRWSKRWDIERLLGPDRKRLAVFY